MGQVMCSDLAVLNIESESLTDIDIENTIDEFANGKVPRVPFLLKKNRLPLIDFKILPAL